MAEFDLTGYPYEYPGYCPICETPTVFKAWHPWLRDHLNCNRCGSVVRERALAMVLNEIRPNWRELEIHESSPAARGISVKLKDQCKNYKATQFFPGESLGNMVDGFRNENLERQGFSDKSFDVVVTLDVMEHVFRPDRVYGEIYRTLRPGGYYIHTFPIERTLTAAATCLAELDADGTIRHLAGKPEYHGNPVSAEGSLVTYRYGYDIYQQIAEWAPFDVRISRFWDKTQGVVGQYNEVVVCQRPASG